ncbi:hypothetical protein THAOC_07714 [Thalassiosira oceanica]|uniref:Uncharacterized protein n=1 Tax=Thalassiosira oceanica TaxID=159749 RepID=K0TJU0_THAOC|nr:hypothetical protein THAOC_07714 [Thalassiosira oceanica]|eukprot:EJK70892.1 hypothetical protein THAOC_07714 [Thalassiosira oceanica]
MPQEVKGDEHKLNTECRRWPDGAGGRGLCVRATAACAVSRRAAWGAAWRAASADNALRGTSASGGRQVSRKTQKNWQKTGLTSEDIPYYTWSTIDVAEHRMNTGPLNTESYLLKKTFNGLQLDSPEYKKLLNEMRAVECNGLFVEREHGHLSSLIRGSYSAGTDARFSGL